MSNYYCRLCLTNCSFENILLFSKEITEMIEYCIPEFEIKIVNNPIICSKCHNLLKQTEGFKRNCLEVQENIKKCISTNNICNETVNICLNNLINLDNNLSKNLPNSQPLKNTLSSFSESYKNFLTSSTSGTSFEEGPISRIKKKSEEVEETIVSSGDNDEFLNLLESSRNINMKVEMEVMIPESSCSNFYDDSIQSKLNVPSCKNKAKAGTTRNRPVSKKVKSSKNIDNPLDVFVEKFCCISCELRLNNFDSLIRHLYSVHQKVGDLYTCMICRYKSQDYKGIKRHYHKVHVNCIDLKGSCLFCFADMENYVKLHQHMRKYHSKNCSTDRFRCNSCDFASRSYDIFRRHFFKSHDFICNFCLKSFDSVECLNRHIGHHPKFSNKK